MNDKTVLITGATSGIGKAAATELARQGAQVVITSRNITKGEDTVKEIQKMTGNQRVDMLEVDLASLGSVRKLVDEYKIKYNSLDVLINNAGGYYGYRKNTDDGHEYTFGVNHLSHFLLTNLLKDMLVSSNARIINVSSEAQRPGKIHFDDLMLENNFGGFKAYSQAKLANIIFSYELERRWGDKGITANAMHPGAVSTNFGNEAKPLFRGLIKIGKPLLKTPEKGADTIVYLATSDDIAEVSGKYFMNRKQVKSNAESYKPETGDRLWRVSEELTGLK
jgi:NAD(P)-dependent dehydrogenase (short-subunit alcohol dehydrogenase family)